MQYKHVSLAVAGLAIASFALAGCCEMVPA